MDNLQIAKQTLKQLERDEFVTNFRALETKIAGATGGLVTINNVQNQDIKHEQIQSGFGILSDQNETSSKLLWTGP